MAIIESMVKVGSFPNKKEWARIKAEIREARKYPINLEACPELPPEVLKEFALMRAEKNCQKKIGANHRPPPAFRQGE
jgi:hypothetical protein